MEKTEFEIRESVLAECQRLCPNKDDQFEFDWGWMKNWGDWFGFYGKCDNPIFVSRQPEYDEYGLFHNFPLAYRLLGLDKRDAMEAERGKSAQEVKDERKRIEDYGMSLIEQVDPSVQEDVMRPIFEAAYAKGLREGASGLSVVMLQNVALNLERGKSAKLVEALEEIKKPWYVFKLGKRASLKSTLEQYKTRCMAIHDIASRAIEAYKEGK